MQCSGLGGCAGAAVNTGWTGNCYPNNMWSGIPRDSGYFQAFHMNNSHFNNETCDGTGRCPSTIAFSVRCVLGFMYCYNVF